MATSGLGAPKVVGATTGLTLRPTLGPAPDMTDARDPKNSSGARRRRTDATTDHLHELAHIERLLRADFHATDPRVHVTGGGARISWTSWDHNSHARGTLTAAVCSEIARSSGWGLATVHDPQGDGEETLSMLTLIHDPHTEADR